MVLSAHRKAVKNIPNYMGFLPTYIAADYAFLDMGKLTAIYRSLHQLYIFGAPGCLSVSL